MSLPRGMTYSWKSSKKVKSVIMTAKNAKIADVTFSAMRGRLCRANLPAPASKVELVATWRSFRSSRFLSMDAAV